VQLTNYQIIIDDIVIEITKKSIKNIRLVVHRSEGRVRISAPSHISDEMLRQFILSKLNWINKHHNRLPKPEELFVSGEIHYFQGRSYLLNIIELDCKAKVEIRDDCYLDLYLAPSSNIDKRRSLLMSWYRKYLEYSIPIYIKQWEPILNVQVKQWGIKLMKTRWGSCNYREHRIWLNLELAKQDPRCLEYVIVHEMVHLLEPNHGKGFVGLMNKHLPHWRILKKQLNRI